MNRKRIFLLTVAAIAIGLLVTIGFRAPIRVAYHSWRMNAEFNTIFGAPQPAGNGLASYDVTGVDVDAVLQRYESHRQNLVDLGVLMELHAAFSSLRSDGSISQSKARSAFVQRMWDVFPNHRHYDLDSDGNFTAWVPSSKTPQWRQFLDSESRDGL